MTVAGVEGTDPVKCSRDIMIVPDKGLDEVAGYNIIYTYIIKTFSKY